MRLEANTFTISKAEARALVAFASPDETRQHLNAILFDPSNGAAVATDGHTLVRLKGLGCAVGPAFLVDRDTLEKASKLAKKDDEITVNGAVSVDGTVMQYADLSECTFPPYEQVIPKLKEDREIAPAVGINTDYLGRLSLVAKACGKVHPRVTCQVSGELDPILYTCEGPDSGDWTVVIMPVRI